jgi:DNA polymerase
MRTRQQYLKELGIELWQTKDRPNPTANQSDTITLDTIKQKVAACKLCELHKTRTNTVFGIGNLQADVVFIGEAPGANEDLQGEPFVGRAGLLLNSMLKSIRLNRDKVYIANILKCRPPNNRDPSPAEVEVCTSYLQQQIAAIKPKLLVAVGRIAAQFLLNTTESMAKLRGNSYEYGETKIPLIITYHPAYLLRSPGEKKKAYADFLMIAGYLKN